MSSDTQHLRRRRFKAERGVRKERGIAAMRARGDYEAREPRRRDLGERCCNAYGHKVARGVLCPRCGWIVGESQDDHSSRRFKEAYNVKTVLEAFNRPNPFIEMLRH